MAGRGKGWEKELEAQAVEARARGHHASRCHSEAKAVSGRIIYSAKGPCDFMGFVRVRHFDTSTRSVPIAFDAKEFEGTALRFKDIRSHQAMQMLSFYQSTAASGVLAKCDAGRFVVPWDVFGKLYQAWAAKEPGAVASVEMASHGWSIDGYPTWLDRIADMSWSWW